MIALCGVSTPRETHTCPTHAVTNIANNPISETNCEVNSGPLPLNAPWTPHATNIRKAATAASKPHTTANTTRHVFVSMCLNYIRALGGTVVVECLLAPDRTLECRIAVS